MDQNNTVTRIIPQRYDNLPSAPRKDKAIKTEEITDFLTAHKDEMALHFLEDHLKKELTSGVLSNIRPGLQDHIKNEVFYV